MTSLPDLFDQYMADVLQFDLLTPEEEIRLAGLIKQGDAEAREKFINCNLRLVVKIAGSYQQYGLPLLDLISEGNMGLMRAVDYFNPDKGAKFATYGALWIKQYIRRALSNQSRTIRLPVYIVADISEITHVITALRDVLGREPSDSEIAEEIGVSASRVAHHRSLIGAPISIHAPAGDGETEISERIADDSVMRPDDNLDQQHRHELLQASLNSLDDRERDIVCRRFGLNGDEQTLEQVGQSYGVTRERVRQVQSIAMKKLHRRIMKLNKNHKP